MKPHRTASITLVQDNPKSSPLRARGSQRQAFDQGFTAYQHKAAREARHAMGQFLGSLRPWTHWVTLTFATRKPLAHGEASARTNRTVPAEQAVKAFKTLLYQATLQQCQQDHPEWISSAKNCASPPYKKFNGLRRKRYERGDCPTWVMAIEDNHGRPGTHVHALVDFSTTSTPPRLALFRRLAWEKEGLNRIELCGETADRISDRPLDDPDWNSLTFAQKRASYMVKYCLKDGTSELHIDPALVPHLSADFCRPKYESQLSFAPSN